MNRKISFYIALIIIIVLALILGAICFYSFSFTYDKGRTEPEKNPISCIIKGTDNINYGIVAGKFNSPYIPNCKKTFADVDLSKITDALDAACSALGYGWDNYLLLSDGNQKDELIIENAKSNGLFAKNINDKMGKYTNPELPTMYSHWVEFNVNGKTYRVFVGDYVNQKDRDDQKGVHISRNYVLEKGKWLSTSDLFSMTSTEGLSNFVQEIPALSYNDIIGKCLKPTR